MKVAGLILGILAFIAFIGLVTYGGVVGEHENTERLRICVEAGGTWNQGQGDCYLPGSDSFGSKD